MSRRWVQRAMIQWGLQVRPVPRAMRPDRKHLPDFECYEPLFRPHLAPGTFQDLFSSIAPYTLVGAERAHVLYTLARQALALEGEWWECGVFQGGTAMMFSALIQGASPASSRRLRLFDTFSGMPEVDDLRDRHAAGDFSDTRLEDVRARIGGGERVVFHAGRMPATFQGLDAATIAFAHIDVDLYRSVRDCCEFVVPRLVSGGIVVFDDYGFPSCPGARAAVDEFFASRPEQPLVLSTGQAVVVRVP